MALLIQKGEDKSNHINPTSLTKGQWAQKREKLSNKEYYNEADRIYLKSAYFTKFFEQMRAIRLFPEFEDTTVN